MANKKNARHLVEQLIGPVTIGSLIKVFRSTHELTLNDLSKKLKLSKEELQKIESSSTQLSLKEVIMIAKKLDEAKHVYARVWCEEQLSRVGMDFDDIMRVI